VGARTTAKKHFAVSGLDAVRAQLGNLTEPPMEDPGRGDGPPPASNDDGGAQRREKRPPKTMPEGCPVIPVGTEDGLFHFLTALGELRSLTADKVANNHIKAMFAPDIDYLYEVERWQQKKLVKTKAADGVTDIEEWIVTGVKTQQVTEDLFDVCAAKGVWNAREKVRGRGAWRADDGSLILHCGNAVYLGGRWTDPGMHEGMVYPTAPAIPRPACKADVTGAELAPALYAELRRKGVDEEAMPADADPAHLLLALIRTWNWSRPRVDPVLAIGWIGAAMMGGALDYRPIAWITGGKAAGKSSFQELLEWIFDGGILQSPDASEAGVRQTLGQQSLPVGLDETEADQDNRKVLSLVKLARLAATSQGNLLRGGQDHKSTEFRATSCFLFSSILVPPITPADRSRMALLELQRLPDGARKPRMDKREVHAIGAWLRRRFAERWRWWPLVLEAYTDALIDLGGQGGRAADQFGTLRAAAHMLLEPEMGRDVGLPDEDELMQWARVLGRDQLVETSEEADEGPMCLEHLLTSQVQLDRGGKVLTVADWVVQAATPTPPNADMMLTSEIRDKRRFANEALARIGVKVVDGRFPGQERLAVAVNHQGLARIFDGSKFAAGVWAQALGRIVGAERNVTPRINHRPTKSVYVPIKAAVDLERDDGGVEAREMEDVR